MKARKQKAAEKDFCESGMPHNRFEVFFDVIKQRYDLLLKLGLIMLLFALPLFAVNYFGSFVHSGLSEQGETTPERLTSLDRMLSFINVLPIVFFGFGLAGVMKIIRNLVWCEPVFLRSDFASGIKQNKLTYSFVFLLVAVANVLTVFLYDVIPVGWLKLLPTAICLAFLFPVAMYVLSATAVYKDGFFSVLVSSVKFFIKTVPVTYLFVLVLFGAMCAELIDSVLIKLIVEILAIVVFLPLYLVAWTVYSHGVFDKMVNSKYYPDFVDKGIFRNDVQPSKNIKES